MLIYNINFSLLTYIFCGRGLKCNPEKDENEYPQLYFYLLLLLRPDVQSLTSIQVSIQDGSRKQEVSIERAQECDFAIIYSTWLSLAHRH